MKPLFNLGSHKEDDTDEESTTGFEGNDFAPKRRKLTAESVSLNDMFKFVNVYTKAVFLLIIVTIYKDFNVVLFTLKLLDYDLSAYFFNNG